MTDDTKLDLTSHNLPADKTAELLRLFPEIRTEGDKIDFDKLKLVLGQTVDVGRERYGMTWPGKADCFKTIQAPSTGTLLPAPEESVDFDTTENLIIEGDNLNVLKLLQKAYLGKVKMIYIDPPYNTGNDFIYPDNYAESLQTYLEYTGQVDTEGRKFGTNTDTDGRFHSRWLNMMYPRLYLARNLLRDDGVILVSVNDIEASKLRSICDEIFGEESFVAQFIWNNEGNIDQQSKIKGVHEYILCYAKNQDFLERPTVIDPNVEETSKLYNDTIENSITKNGPANPPSIVALPIGFPAAFESGVIEVRDDQWPHVLSEIEIKEYKVVRSGKLESGWSSRNLLDLFINNGCEPIKDNEGKETWFSITHTGAIYVYKRRSENQGHVLSVIRNVGTTKQNSNVLADWGIDFSYPKPVLLIRYLIEVFTNKDKSEIVLDFFAGSGTTAHAILDLNKKDDGNRKLILIQLPESTNKNGYSSIADMTKERVRRVIKKLNDEETGQLPVINKKQDRGFRVFKLAESNFKGWESAVPKDGAALVQQLEMHIDHIREGRTSKDILYEILLKSGFPLTTPVEKTPLPAGEGQGVREAYSVAGGGMLICLEKDLTLETVRAMAELKPQRVICLDMSFAGNDQLKANAVQIFKTKDIVFKTV